MKERNIFLNLSALDHRYYLSNQELFDRLACYLSEQSLIDYCVRVEIALLKAHLESKGLLSSHQNELTILEAGLDPDEVYAEEEKTQHNIRALVNVMKSKLSDEASAFVHMGATSVDILDTAASLRYKDVTREVILPLLMEVENLLIKISREHAFTVQVGRTHGQHAVPITFGFALAEYVSRLGKSIAKIEELSLDLRGKFAGAVGAYNSTSLLTADPLAFEEKVLSSLGLKASDHSTQLVEPEHLLRLLLEINTAFGVLANLADDLRHLQRSEISEIREFFTSDQVGSSTMPQKRNPWNSEHVKSLWKAFAPRVMTFFMDQISEHQRDLTNSASGRFVTDYLAGFCAAVSRMKKILSTLYVDKTKLLSNVTLTGDFVLAEAAYILLAAGGEKDAHEIIRKVTLKCEKEGKKMGQVLPTMPDVWERISLALNAVGEKDPSSFFTEPGKYTGRASQKTILLADKYQELMDAVGKKIR